MNSEEKMLVMAVWPVYSANEEQFLCILTENYNCFIYICAPQYASAT